MRGRIKKLGELRGTIMGDTRTEVEIYRIAYDLRDKATRLALKEDRHRALRQLLEQNGHVVRLLHIAVGAERDEPEPDVDVQICDSAHVQSPDDRRSEWIEFNCRPGVVQDL